MFCDPPIARLRRLAASMKAHELPAAEDCAWLVDGIDRYDADADTTLDRVLGLTPTPGQQHWRTVEARARRDATIVQLRSLHFADLSNAEAGRVIHQMARRLQNTAWQSPQSDARKQLIVDALNTGMPFPGERWLQTIFMKSATPYPLHGDRRMMSS